VVVLRGALDGLAAVAPLGERSYAARRGALALKPPGEPGGALPPDAHLALHPALAQLRPYWGKGELLFVHAAGNGYHTRSHFDAQDLMESGLSAKTGISDGWLNRALSIDPRNDASRRALIAYYERTNNPAKAAEHRQKPELP